MAAANRASRLTKLVADLKKRYKPAPPVERPLFETLLYATLLENSSPEAATKTFDDLKSSYFDWNEVRVSTRAELAERGKSLNDPADTADRLKRTLQSIFETVYSFDLESLKKQNLGQAVKQVAAFDGATPFVVNFATQHALAGHAIAVNAGVLLALQVMDVVTEAEAKKGVVPGLERAIPKNKGVEVQALLHELGVEVGRNPYGAAARKLLTELDPTCKDRLPKRPRPADEAPAAEALPPAPAKPPVPGKSEAPKDSSALGKKPAAAPTGKNAADGKKPAPPRTDAKPPSPVGKKPEAKPEPKSAPTVKPAAAKAPASKAAPGKAAPAKPAPPVKSAAAKPQAKKPQPPKKAPGKKPLATKPAAKKPAPKPAAAAKKDTKKAKPPTAAKKLADKKPAKRKPK